MKSYLYILRAEKPFFETELGRIQEEICRLFKCTDIDMSVAEGREFTIRSPLGMDEAQRLAAEAARSFGLSFKAGGEVG